jgi:hypothetical protein
MIQHNAYGSYLLFGLFRRLQSTVYSPGRVNQKLMLGGLLPARARPLTGRRDNDGAARTS